MVDPIQITSVPVIAALVYGALAFYKYMVKSEKWVRIIPVIAAALGVVLGVAAFYAVPEVMPAGNVFIAILVGGASGLAATGTHQIYKQLSKDKDDEINDGKNS